MAETWARADHVHPAQTSVNTADNAKQLAAAHTIRVNLGSTSAVKFDGSADITPGVTGTLPIARGGTGQTAITNGNITRNATNTKSLTGKWYRWGCVVLVTVTGTMADSCTATYSSYVIGTGLPKAVTTFDALNAVNVDGVSDEMWAKVDASGTLSVSPRKMSMAGRVFNASFVYLAS